MASNDSVMFDVVIFFVSEHLSSTSGPGSGLLATYNICFVYRALTNGSGDSSGLRRSGNGFPLCDVISR